jgi:hypothetical protein
VALPALAIAACGPESVGIAAALGAATAAAASSPTAVLVFVTANIVAPLRVDSM